MSLIIAAVKYIISIISYYNFAYTDSLSDPIGLVSDSNLHTEKEETSNTSEAGSSPKNEKNTGFSNSPSLASISSLSNYYILFNVSSFLHCIMNLCKPVYS